MREQRDLDLIRLYWPEDVRDALDALMAIDRALADVVATSSEPALGVIRLAWWREALERLDNSPAPAEPRLQAAAALLLPRGISGAMLAEVEDGYTAMLEAPVDTSRVGAAGAAFFVAGARLLGADDSNIPEAGKLWMLASAVRRGLVPPGVDWNADALVGHRFARRIRPLTALARLGRRDLLKLPEVEPEATPARAAALLSHRLFGQVA